jgi:hypothetical protein
MFTVVIVVIGIWLCLCALICYVYFKTIKNIDLVIARYNEDLSWLHKINIGAFKSIIVYNKGKRRGVDGIVGIQEIDLPNVGRCDHTYIYHIIHNYDHLAKVTIFLPGSCDMPMKWNIAQKIVYKTLETESSVFHGHRYNDVRKDLYDFKLDKWKASNVLNNTLNAEDDLSPCPERPFGKWFEKNFGHLHIDAVAYLGIFAVSKKHIHNRSLESYKELINLEKKSVFLLFNTK